MKRQIENFEAIFGQFVKLAGNEKKEGKFSAELNSRIRKGDFVVTPETHFVTKLVTGAGGTQHLLDTETEKIPGISSISKDRLPKNEGHMFAEIAVEYGVGDPADTGSIKFDKAFPAKLENATLEIRQLNRQVVSKLVSDLTAKMDPQSPNQKVVDLEIPSTLRDDEPFEINLIYPKTGSLSAATAADNHFVRVKTLGFSTRRKA